MSVQEVTTAPAVAGGRDRDPSDDVVLREWLPGQPPRRISVQEALGTDGVISIEVAESAEVSELYALLRPICGPDLELPMIVDLLEPDELPKVARYGESGHLRAVSAFGVLAHDPANRGDAGTVTFELVEFLANRHWLVACRHRAQAYAAASSCEHVERSLHADLFATVEDGWENGENSTAGDLGVLLLHQLTRSYQPARRQLDTWLVQWESAFFSSDSANREALGRIHGLATEFRTRLSALNVPLEEARTSWFAAVSGDDLARRTDKELDATVESLARLGDRVRGGFDLLQSRDVAQQTREMAHANEAMTKQLVIAERQRQDAERQQRESERRQRRMEVAGALFLVPTLVAGIWGENTWVPGERHEWGFAVSVGVMFVFTAIALVALQVVNVKRLARRDARRTPVAIPENAGPA